MAWFAAIGRRGGWICCFSLPDFWQMEFKEFECFGVMSAASRLLDRTAARRILLVLTLPRDGRAEAEKTNSFKTEADSDMRDEEWEGKETRKKRSNSIISWTDGELSSQGENRTSQGYQQKDLGIGGGGG